MPGQLQEIIVCMGVARGGEEALGPAGFGNLTFSYYIAS